MSKGSKTATNVSKNDKGGFSYPIAIILASSGLAFLAVATQQVFTGQIKIHGKTNVTDLTSYTDKLQFVAKYASLQVFVLLIATINVGLGRAKHGAENPLIGREDRISAQRNIHQNTLEQVVLSLGAQISLIAFLTAEQTLKVIPLLNLVWTFGRIFFFIGYPNYRSFGFSITFFPTAAAAIYAVNKFAEVQYGLKFNIPLNL